MAHHGNDKPFGGEGPETIAAAFRKMSERPLIGATGMHEKGMMRADDEGGIQFAVLNRDGNVVVDYGTPVTWVGMDPQQACDLAALLIRQARIAAKKTGELITVTV